MSRLFSSAKRGQSQHRQCCTRSRLRHIGLELVNDPAGAVGRGVRDHRVQLSVVVLAEAVDGQAVGKLLVEELWQVELVDRAILQVGIKQSAIDARGRAVQGEVAEDVFADKLGDGAAAVDE